jgi:hypothetical protein
MRFRAHQALFVITYLAAAILGALAVQPVGFDSNKRLTVTPWITATNSSATLASSPYNLTDLFSPIGLTLSLPEAGDYLVFDTISANVLASTAGSYGNGYWYSTTDGAKISGTEQVLGYAQTDSTKGDGFYGTVTNVAKITVSRATTIDFFAARSGAASYVTASIYDNTEARTRAYYVKVGP